MNSSLVSATDSFSASLNSVMTSSLPSGTSISTRLPFCISKARLFSTSMMPVTRLFSSQMGMTRGAILLPKRSRSASKVAL